MKKLLAQVLCVMLLVSVVPTAALAEESSGYEAGSGLAGAYQARLDLFAALGRLAGAEAYVRGLVGLEALNAEGILDDIIADYKANAVESLEDWPDHGVSYPELWVLIAPYVYEGYNAAGQAVGTNVAEETGLVIDAINVVVDAVITAFGGGSSESSGSEGGEQSAPSSEQPVSVEGRE